MTITVARIAAIRRGTKKGKGDDMWMSDAEWNEILTLAQEAVRNRSRYVPHEAEWIWSLDAPEVSGWRWIETWDESKLELGILRFTVGDELPSNVACWRYVDPPSKSRAPVTTCEPHQGEKT
jgi:hypothetical protein